MASGFSVFLFSLMLFLKCVVQPQAELAMSNARLNKNLPEDAEASTFTKIIRTRHTISYFFALKDDAAFAGLPPEKVLNGIFPGIDGMDPERVKDFCSVLYLRYADGMRPNAIILHHSYKTASKIVTIRKSDCDALGYNKASR